MTLRTPTWIACLLSATSLASPSAGAEDGLGPPPSADARPPRVDPSVGEVEPSDRQVSEAGESFVFPRSAPKPPPLHIDYVSYGLAVTVDLMADAGGTCRQSGGSEPVPCILGSGGGLVLRGGYRSPGPWYVGGAYQFSKTDSSNLYRLAILQQLRAEMRYVFDLGYQSSPYVIWGLGGVVYGNEWGVETGGGTAFGGVGVEMQLARLVSLGIAIHYQPMILAGFRDTANYERSPGLAQYFRIEFQVEVKSELTRN